jgi:hypothetical protein
MSSRSISLVVVTIGLCASLAAAQQVQRPQTAWLERAQSLTNDSLKDVKSLETLDGALVLGQLGAQWWNIDASQARKWLLKAVEAVELEPAKESRVERGRRLAVARSLLPVISTADQKLWERLRAVLTPGETHSSDSERATSADALVEAALVVLKTDPRRAASMGSAALRIGPPTAIQHLLWGLRKRDATLADQLFGQALAVARTTSDQEFLNSLRYAAFPELMGTGFDAAAAPTDAIRGDMLLVLADDLQQRMAILASKGIRDCGLAPATVDGLQIYFDRLQPQRAELVRQFVRTCQESRNQNVSDTGGEPESTGIPDTVDSLLAKADQTADKKIKRPTYLARAARLAAQQKNFERAIKIIDSMSDEERKFIGIWDTWRRDWAVALAVQLAKRDDMGGAHQVIKAVPDALRPFAKIYFVDRLPKDLYTQLAREFLDESRKDLGSSEGADLEKTYWYLMVVRLYSKFRLDSEAVEAFKDAIASLRRVKSAEPKEIGDLSEDLTTKIIQADFPVSLLESYPYLISEVVSSITSVPRRAKVHLDLVQISLKEYRTLAAKSTLERKTSSTEPK